MRSTSWREQSGESERGMGLSRVGAKGVSIGCGEKHGSVRIVRPSSWTMQVLAQEGETFSQQKQISDMCKPSLRLSEPCHCY